MIVGHGAFQDNECAPHSSIDRIGQSTREGVDIEQREDIQHADGSGAVACDSHAQRAYLVKRLDFFLLQKLLDVIV